VALASEVGQCRGEHDFSREQLAISFQFAYRESQRGSLRVRLQFTNSFSKDIPMTRWTIFLNLAIGFFISLATAHAQPAAPATPAPTQPNPAPSTTRPAPPQIVSPEVSTDRHITFRILAPKAESVKLSANDIQGTGPVTFSKDAGDVWQATVGPIEPGAYRYQFNVDGVPVIDPRNPATSESNNNVWSLVYVPGAEFEDTADVPHGAVAAVTYYSTALKKFRRMHVYTPPGYELGTDKLPVFYLLHGASDSDGSWSSVGRAGFILDNLIAAKEAKPMLMVMPAGHTRPFGGTRPEGAARPRVDEFLADFTGDIVPYIEKNYRVLADKQHHAVAGLSMGGGQTLNIWISNPDKFGYVGVFSSGIFGGGGRPGVAAAPPSFEEQHQQTLDDQATKKDLKLIWFAIGKEDRGLENSHRTADLLKKHGFDVAFQESSGGHIWINWRNYLNEFAPLLFQ
jgi:enterochelin esterase-like enzyme